MAKVIRSRSLRAAVVAGVMALLLGSAVPAQAAVVPVFFDLQGGLVSLSGLNEIPVPEDIEGSLEGEWDNESGEYVGSFFVAPLALELANGFTASLSTGVITGTIPPDGSVGALIVPLTITVVIPDIAECDVSLGNTVLDAQLTEEGNLLLSGDFVAQTPTETLSCNAGIISILSGFLDFPAAGSMDLTFVPGEPPAPGPGPGPEPGPGPVPSPEAVVEAATPKFTG